MGSILELHNEWRDTLRIASFRGVYFHVESSARQSGRRVVTHQYPKRNIPYAEDMGREALHWQFSGYILLNDKKLNRGPNAVYANMIAQRNAMLEALEMDGPGELIHPSLSITFGGGREGASSGGPMMVMVERYGVSESRQKGGFYEFDLAFVEAGEAPKVFKDDSRKLLETATTNLDKTVVATGKRQFTLTGVSIAGGGSNFGGGTFGGPAAIRIR